jgi:pimeloyl-ACP methyl ester carboxylesterase
VSRYLRIFASAAGEAATLEAYDGIVRRWPAPCVELDVPTSGGMTHVIASGPEGAEPVILLHAYFATATAWYRTAGALSGRYRTYAVDILGDVGRSRPVCPMVSLDDFAQWFTELADALGVSRVHLVGNSIGGFIAAYCAMRLKARIRTLVLIGPAATVHAMPAFYVHMFIPKMLYIMAPWMPGRERSMNRAVDWMNAGLPGDGPWDRLFRLALIHGTGASRVFPRVYSRKEFAQVAAPTLLIVGDHERIYSPGAAIEAASRLIPGIAAELIPQAHHIAAIAQPTLVNARILRFLSTAEVQRGEHDEQRTGGA